MYILYVQKYTLMDFDTYQHMFGDVEIGTCWSFDLSRFVLRYLDVW